ncbi:hypothetical protein SAMN05444266_101613 [Chitinophaga jiangningensis]|uniref:Uncharacterized protein n=1 Tax=Chitinophaga jiangningensis TaxID=1419482 RepID=A0A1M6WG76_9BACT|nr:hypothetical protein [Chitinophaga jiangningensis]SHK92717.1 hypothetical protein SAMN05444266_101613 [Chitinophaga jiangningensis]
MNAIDNKDLLHYRSNGPISAFTPKVQYTYDGAAKTLEVTDASTYPAGQALKKVIVKVHDHYGKDITDSITVTGVAGKKVISVANLNAAKGLNISVTVISDAGLIADGTWFKIAAAGEVSNWDKQ